MKIKIIKNNEVLLEEDFFNKILIKNFIFENPYAAILAQSQDSKSNKNQNQQANVPNKELYTYYLICSFDLSELDKNKIMIENNLFWEIRIFSSEVIYFSKDTSKEDREKAVKDSWEQIEKGRSELAKTSRLRFLGINKKMRGETLSPNEELIINTERVRKTAQSYDGFASSVKLQDTQKRKLSNAAQDPKSKNPNNTQGKNAQIDIPPVVNEYSKYERLELKPIVIKPEAHRSYYIRNFINYSTRERTVTKGQNVAISQSNFNFSIFFIINVKITNSYFRNNFE